jgi:hypothetical protein
VDTERGVSHAGVAAAGAVAELALRAEREELDQVGPRLRQASVETGMGARQMSDEMADRRDRDAEPGALGIGALEVPIGGSHLAS